MTVGLYRKPKQRADTDLIIGEMLRTHRDGVQEIRVGSGQAWYYPADRTLVPRQTRLVLSALARSPSQSA